MRPKLRLKVAPEGINRQPRKYDMAFTNKTKREALLQSGLRCECWRLICGHVGRCNVPFFTQDPYTGQWALIRRFEVNHKQSQRADGPDTLANTEVLCLDCHRNTRSYGANLTR